MNTTNRRFDPPGGVLNAAGTRPIGSMLCRVILSVSLWTLNPLPARADVDFSLSPATVSNTFSGTLTVAITGLSPGQGVRFSKFVDENANGLIDAGEPLVAHFGLRDGQMAMIGGVRLTAVPCDEDGSTNGVIQAQFPVTFQNELERVAAPYLYRVSHPTNAFPAVVKPFTVTPAAYGQSFAGTILSGGSPVPGATVAALTGADSDFVSGVTADDSGQYSLSLPPGTYQLVAIRPGYVANLAQMPNLDLRTGQTITTNLLLAAATRTISGQLRVAQATNLLPGFPAFCESEAGELAVAFTDSTGSFSIGVNPGIWAIEPNERAVSAHSLLSPDDPAQVDASTGNVTGLQLELPRATALVYGSVKDGDGKPVAGLPVWCQHAAIPLENSGVTDANGEFSIGVNAGNWWLGFDATSPALTDLILQGTNVTLADGGTHRIDLVALRATAHLRGFVRKPDGSPVDDQSILAWTSGLTSSGRTGNDGSFDLPVFGSRWTLRLENSEAQAAGLIGPSLEDIIVTDHLDLDGLLVVARPVTARIHGRITANGSPIDNLWVSAHATFDVTNRYDVGANTDANGDYSLSIADGTWNLGLNCGDLENRGYSCPDVLSVLVLGTSQVRDFVLVSASVPPWFGAPAISGGQFMVTVNGQTGRRYRVWSTTDLFDWNIATTNQGPSFQLVDPVPPGAPRRFYGIELLP